MPFPNEHAARQKDPGDYERFRRDHPEGFPDGVDVVFGIDDDGKSEVQSVRFDRKKWTPVKAKEWLEAHDFSVGQFEEAIGKADVDYRPQRFHLQRDVDVNGISGTGVVASGVVWPNGWVSLAWITATPSLTFHESIDNVIEVHGHDGMTRVVFDDVRLAVSKATIEKHLGPREAVIAKVDRVKQIVYGVVLDPYVVDAQDDWVPAASVEDTAHGWLTKSREVHLQHGDAVDAVPVESWIVPYPTTEDAEKAAANEPHRIWRMKFGSEWVHSGSWVLGVRVLDPEAWAAVVSGELGAYSIGGSGMRRQVETVPMPAVEVLTVEAP